MRSSAFVVKPELLQFSRPKIEHRKRSVAVANGRIDGDKAMMESLIAFKRAGADGVLTDLAPPRGRADEGPVRHRARFWLASPPNGSVSFAWPGCEQGL